MRKSFASLALLFVLFPFPARASPPALPGPRLAQATTYDIIRTKDGKVYTGHVLKELEKGFLFKTVEGETLVIEFAQVEDIQRTAPPGAAVPVAPPQFLGALGQLERAAPPGAAVPVAPPQPGPPPAGPASKIAALDRQIQSKRDEQEGIIYVFPMLGIAVGAVLVVLPQVISFGSTRSEATTGYWTWMVSGGTLGVAGLIYMGINARSSSRLQRDIDDLEEDRKKLAEPTAGFVAPVLALRF